MLQKNKSTDSGNIEQDNLYEQKIKESFTKEFTELNYDGIKFTSDPFIENLKVFFKNKKKVLSIITHHVRITKYKIYISLPEKYLINQNVILIPYRDLKIAKLTQIIRNFIKNRDLIIIMPIDNKTETDDLKALEFTYHMTSHSKLIILSEMKYQSQFNRLLDYMDFKRLDSKSREIILDRNVNFQGNEIKLKKLFFCQKDTEQHVEKLMTSPVLIHLMENTELLCIGETVNDNEENFSLPRKMITPDGRIISEKNFFTEINKIETKPITCISGTTKCGKTVLLKNLHKYYRIYCRNEDRYKWIFRVSLSNQESICQLKKLQKFNELNMRYIFKNDLIDIVYSLCKTELTGHYHRFNEELFKYHIEYSRIIILFDEIDVIGQYIEGFYFLVKQFLRFLERTQIVITARPRLSEQLQGNGCVKIIFKLKRFGNDEQKLLLSEYWKMYLSSQEVKENNEENHYEKFESNFFSFLSNFSTKEAILNIGISLINHMLRKICNINLKNYSKYMKQYNNISVYELYDDYCKNVFEYNLNKLQQNEPVNESVLDELYRKFERDHQWLAVIILLNEKDLVNMNIHKSLKKNSRSIIRNFTENEFSYNIIAKVILNQAIFKDDSLAEFFLLKFFIKSLALIDISIDETPICKYFLTNILTNFKNLNIRMFFDEWLSKDSLEKNNLSLLMIRFYKRLAKSDYYDFITKIVELSTQELNFVTCEFFLSHLNDSMKLKCFNELQIDEHESTVLHYVAEFNHFRMATFLTENYFNISAKDIWGRTSIYTAMKKSNIEMAKYLRESCIATHEYLPRSFIEINCKSNKDKMNISKEGPWLIHRTVKEYFSEQEAKAIQVIRDFNVISCYILAARYGNLDLLQFLINQDNRLNKENFTEAESKALLIASIYGHFNIVETLLENGTSELFCDNFGNTALCLAAEFGHFDIVRLLLRKENIDLDIQNNDGESCLHIATKYGYDSIVKYLIDIGFNIDLQDVYGDTALMIAAREGYTEIFNLLLQKRAKYQLMNKFKEDAVFIATEYGRLDILKLLLKLKPNVNNCNFFDETPILVALLHGDNTRRLVMKRNCILDYYKLKRIDSSDIKQLYRQYLYGYCCLTDVNYEGHLKRFIKPDIHPFLNINVNIFKKIVEVLVESYADVHRTKIRIGFFAAAKGGHLTALKTFLNQRIHFDVDKPGETALSIAIKDGRLEVVEMLLNAGVSVNIPNESAISLALKYEQNSILKILLQYSDAWNSEDISGETALFEAARKNDFQHVHKFLQRGANINQQNRRGETPLFVACFEGHFKIVKFLVEKHADVNKKNWTGENPLYVAAFRGYFDICRILLKRGAHIINQNKKSKLYLLLEVLFNGYYDIAKLLINYGADVNVHDYFGVTPLLVAAKFGLSEITKLILKSKVNIDEKNLNNETALIMAAGSGHLQIVELLVAKKATLNLKTRTEETALYVASKFGHLLIVEFLLQKCLTDLNVANVDGFTPIFIAAKNGHIYIVKLLFEKNASLNPNQYEETPLLIAAREGHSEIVEFMIEKGAAKVDSQNYDGKTPLFVAAENGHLKICKILLEKGANVDIPTLKNETALFIAIQNHYDDIINLLIENYADIEIVNNNGESSFSLARKLGYNLKKMWFSQ